MMGRDYHREYSKKYYHRRREEYKRMLGGVCCLCGCKTGLEFDHIDPYSKTFAIGKLLNVSKEKALLEIKKCQLLCRKCHNKKTVNKDMIKKKVLKGSEVGTAILNENDVKKIKGLLKQGKSCPSIAKLFHVSRATIYAVKSKRTWKNV